MRIAGLLALAGTLGGCDPSTPGSTIEGAHYYEKENPGPVPGRTRSGP